MTRAIFYSEISGGTPLAAMAAAGARRYEVACLRRRGVDMAIPDHQALMLSVVRLTLGIPQMEI